MNSSLPFLVNLVLIGNLCASVLMTGIICFIQIVQYPLLNNISAFDFSCYFKKFISNSSWIIYPIMTIEIGFALWLSFLPLQAKLQLPVLISYFLLAMAFLNTFLIQTPLHQKLQVAFDNAILSKILFFNWIRLFSWALRSIILFWIILFLR